MNLSLLSLLIAFLGYSVQNISQASQKIGFLKMKKDRKIGIIIWSAATVGTGLSTLILLVAVSMGQVSLVGAMAGTGLVSMTVYSRFVMKEFPGKRELAGVGLILISAVLIGIFAQDAAVSIIILDLLIIKLIIVSIIYIILWFIFRRRKRILCVVLGGYSGALGGFVSQFQKISTSGTVQGELITGATAGIATLLNPFTLFWILLSISSMVVLQFAHKNGQPMQVIPSFSANFILVPVIGGVTCFGEVLLPVQWIAVGVIIIGVLMITTNSSVNEKEKSN